LWIRLGGRRENKILEIEYGEGPKLYGLPRIINRNQALVLAKSLKKE
jgi:hypothetical protein